MIAPPDNSSLYKSLEGYQRMMESYDAALQGMELPHQTCYVETSFGPTHILICGRENSKPVLLWHGQNANVLSWLHWLPALASTYRTYVVDVIGGMGKSAPSRPSKKGLAYGQWGAEVLEGLELKKASMIGASQGGWLIVKLGNVAPEVIESATLMSTAGFLSLNMMMILRMIPRVLFKPPEQAAKEMLSIVNAPNVPADPFFLELFELLLRYVRSESAPPVLRDEEIKKLTAPTYLLMGQYETTLNPYKVIERGVKLLPNLVRAEIVPGVGHSMLHRQTDWVISRVLDFLERNESHYSARE
jgi:pimeloyl-ACP methyl ester carboxylesterase